MTYYSQTVVSIILSHSATTVSNNFISTTNSKVMFLMNIFVIHVHYAKCV